MKWIIGLFILFLPFVSNGQSAVPDRIVCLPPQGYAINLVNSSAVQDRTGAVFCATRPSSGVGGMVWRMDNYVDADHPGTPRILLGGDPAHAQDFFGNSQLMIDAQGRLRYPSVVVNNVTERKALAVVSYLVPEFTP